MSDTLYDSLRTKWSMEYAKQYKIQNNINGKLSPSIKQSEEYRNGRVEYIDNKFKEFYNSKENQCRLRTPGPPVSKSSVRRLSGQRRDGCRQKAGYGAATTCRAGTVSS